jgi:hypothetical protein
MTCRSIARSGIVSLLVGLAIGTAVLTGAASAASVRAQQGSVRSLVLTTADVSNVYGAGLRTLTHSVVTNQEIAAAQKAVKSSGGLNMTTVGRVTGFISAWFRGSPTRFLSVTSVVDQYQNSGVLHTDFAQLSHYNKHFGGVAVHVSTFAGVGDEALLVTVTTQGRVAIGVAFQRGKYLGQVMESVRPGKVSLATLSKLAAIEDQRIQAHG